MTVDKKKAAYKAAAKYPTAPDSAAIEFAIQTRRSDLIISEFLNLKAEFFSLLPTYRFPANGKIAEQIIFFNPIDIKTKATVYPIPEFLKQLEKGGISGSILSEVKEYIREAELLKVELTQCKDELEALKSKFLVIQNVYDKYSDERPSKRNTKVVQSIGLSTGKKPKRIDHAQAYIDYVKLVRHHGLSRINAAGIIHKKHGFNSFNSTLKSLYDSRKSLYSKWEQVYPSSFPQIKKHLKGLIPARKY